MIRGGVSPGQRVPVGVAALPPVEARVFDLYAHAEGGAALAQEALAGLPAGGTVFVGRSARPAAAAAALGALPDRLADTGRAPAERAACLHAAAALALDDLYARPEAADTRERARTLAATTEAYIAPERAAFTTLLGLARPDGPRAMHALYVGLLAAGLARQLGLAAAYTRKLVEGAWLHDLGHTVIPPELLARPGPLSPAERAVVREHPALGVGLCAAHGPLDEVVRAAILGHHERLDGQGYPYGDQGERVPLAARLVAVADVYAALTADRPHRPAIASADALDQMKAVLSGGLDPELFAELVVLLARRDPGW